MSFLVSIPLWGWIDIFSNIAVLAALGGETDMVLKRLFRDNPSDLLPPEPKRKAFKKFCEWLLIAGIAGEIGCLPFSLYETSTAEKQAAIANDRASTNEIMVAELNRATLQLAHEYDLSTNALAEAKARLDGIDPENRAFKSISVNAFLTLPVEDSPLKIDGELVIAPVFPPPAMSRPESGSFSMYSTNAILVPNSRTGGNEYELKFQSIKWDDPSWNALEYMDAHIGLHRMSLILNSQTGKQFSDSITNISLHLRKLPRVNPPGPISMRSWPVSMTNELTCRVEISINDNKQVKTMYVAGKANNDECILTNIDLP